MWPVHFKSRLARFDDQQPAGGQVDVFCAREETELAQWIEGFIVEERRLSRDVEPPGSQSLRRPAAGDPGQGQHDEFPAGGQHPPYLRQGLGVEDILAGKRGDYRLECPGWVGEGLGQAIHQGRGAAISQEAGGCLPAHLRAAIEAKHLKDPFFS